MCGIVGYIGPKPAVPILLDGLSKLEYRGYDSAGIAVQQDDSLAIVKQTGRIAALRETPALQEVKGTVGIAHTRWATHGAPTVVNAHPHADCKGEIAIVHNGIVENYHQLRTQLESEGHKFASATDSEVLAHLIEKNYTGDLAAAVRAALHEVSGTFGLAVVHKTDAKLVAARRGSPLILGIGKGENLIASDVSAVIALTKDVVYLDDDQVAEVTADGFSVTDLDGKPVEMPVQTVTWDADQLEKGGYKHFMLKEIMEQPLAVRQALTGRLKDGKVTLDLKLPEKVSRIVMVACGTSWHAGLTGKYIIEQLVGIPVEVDYASEFRYRQPLLRPDDLLIAISQSGETADTLAAIDEAKEHGVPTLGIVNVVGSTIAREVDSVLYLNAGPEIGVASTKAFTCQVVCMLLLALSWQEQQGKTPDAKLIADLESLPDTIETTVKQSDAIATIAADYKETRDAIFLGRLGNFPVALEGALKLKEISYVHAEGYPAAEMKHGPIALVDDKMLVVFLAPSDEMLEKVVSNMQEIKARSGQVLAVVTEKNGAVDTLADHTILVPLVHKLLQPLIDNLPLQLLAYHIADQRGIDVDKPRNLAKSVTVE